MVCCAPSCGCRLRCHSFETEPHPCKRSSGKFDLSIVISICKLRAIRFSFFHERVNCNWFANRPIGCIATKWVEIEGINSAAIAEPEPLYPATREPKLDSSPRKIQLTATGLGTPMLVLLYRQAMPIRQRVASPLALGGLHPRACIALSSLRAIGKISSRRCQPQSQEQALEALILSGA